MTKQKKFNNINKHHKENAIGLCRLCCKRRLLTWDHVPPKSCWNANKVFYNNLSLDKTIPTNKKYRNLKQNGNKYLTLCRNCNNLLGTKYDRALQDYSIFIANLLRTKNNTKCMLQTCHIKINRLCRAICGHFLAANEKFDDSRLEAKIREFVLNDRILPPNDMQLLNWVYPYKTVFIVRNFVVCSTYKGIKCPDGYMSIINSFPMAYILVNNGYEDCGLIDLFKFCTQNIDDYIDIPIVLTSQYYSPYDKLRHFMWPHDTGTSIIIEQEDLHNKIQLGLKASM